MPCCFLLCPDERGRSPSYQALFLEEGARRAGDAPQCDFLPLEGGEPRQWWRLACFPSPVGRLLVFQIKQQEAPFDYFLTYVFKLLIIYKNHTTSLTTDKKQADLALLVDTTAFPRIVIPSVAEGSILDSGKHARCRDSSARTPFASRQAFIEGFSVSCYG